MASDENKHINWTRQAACDEAVIMGLGLKMNLRILSKDSELATQQTFMIGF